jgi:hypothetical protein
MYQVVIRAWEAGVEERPDGGEGEEGEEEIGLEATRPHFAEHEGIIA